MKNLAPLAVALAAVAVGTAACVPPRGYYPYYGPTRHGPLVSTHYGNQPWWDDDHHGGESGWGGEGGERGDHDDHDDDHHPGPRPWWLGNGQGQGGEGGERGDHDDDHHPGPRPWWLGNGQGQGGEGGERGRDDHDGPRPLLRHDGSPTPRPDGGACGAVYWPGCERG